MCNLHRAEAIATRHLTRLGFEKGDIPEALRAHQLDPKTRDELSLVYRPGDPVHTLTSTNSNLYWICGPRGRAGA